MTENKKRLSATITLGALGAASGIGVAYLMQAVGST
jgi:hypothetical protein